MATLISYAILGFQGLLGCDALLPPLSLHPEDGCSMDLRKVNILLHHYTMSQPRRPRLKMLFPFENHKIDHLECR
jgi:hypothetical protein